MASDQLEQGIPLLLLCKVGFAEVQPDQDNYKKSHLHTPVLQSRQPRVLLEKSKGV